MMENRFDALAGRVLAGGSPSREDGLAILRSPDSELQDLLAATCRVRRRFHGDRVKVHVLLNAKMGNCPEDCGYCAQSVEATRAAGAGNYPLVSVEQILEKAREASRNKAWKFCIVTATRGPGDRDLDVICEAVRRIKKEVPIRVCTSLGLLTDEKARRLAEAGVDRFNHNLETSERFFPEVCSTHSYQDRLETLRKAKAAGMELCCGGIVGMGEADEDLVDLALALRELDAASIPVNFLDAREGTPMAGRPRLQPTYCLKVLCMFRFFLPAKDLRVAGGREVNLRSLQPLALYAVNSIFTQGYLTTPGNPAYQDHQMIRDMGFVPEVVTEPAWANPDA